MLPAPAPASFRNVRLFVPVESTASPISDFLSRFRMAVYLAQTE
jgi:hypothetical protein